LFNSAIEILSTVKDNMVFTGPQASAPAPDQPYFYAIGPVKQYIDTWVGPVPFRKILLRTP